MDPTVKKEKVKLEIKDTTIAKLVSYKYPIDYWDEQTIVMLMKYPAVETPVVIDPECRIGIEVEVENVPGWHEEAQNVWIYHEDNSLRNNGREFVTYPIKGQAIPTALQILFNEVLPRGYDFSKRTSVHIHMNVRNMTPSQIVSLICLFIVFEKSLYRFVGNDRDKNIFCVPLQQTLISNALLEAMNGGFRTKRWYKYAGLNILPIQTQGSVEFRQLYGTDDIPMIINWINLLQRLRMYAAQYPLDTILEEIKALNTNSQYDYYLRKVFANDADLLSGGHLSSDIESGVICVKQCTLNNLFHQTVIGGLNAASPLLTTLLVGIPKIVAKAEAAQYVFENARAVGIENLEDLVVHTTADPPSATGGPEREPWDAIPFAEVPSAPPRMLSVDENRVIINRAINRALATEARLTPTSPPTRPISRRPR